ncbi:hypothetical protein EDC01DRAFT_630552 [Geopyxis carbonaria]|nr:hypothetical protein EDC01DRAFT_630552 [Geopyxis carbonaria]
MSDIVPFLAIPPHMRKYLRPQQHQDRADTPQPDEVQDDDAMQRTDLPLAKHQGRDTDLSSPSLQQKFEPFTSTAAILDFTDSPVITVNLNKPTLLDFFDASGIMPSYTTFSLPWIMSVTRAFGWSMRTSCSAKGSVLISGWSSVLTQTNT